MTTVIVWVTWLQLPSGSLDYSYHLGWCNHRFPPFRGVEETCIRVCLPPSYMPSSALDNLFLPSLTFFIINLSVLLTYPKDVTMLLFNYFYLQVTRGSRELVAHMDRRYGICLPCHHHVTGSTNSHLMSWPAHILYGHPLQRHCHQSPRVLYSNPRVSTYQLYALISSDNDMM